MKHTGGYYTKGNNTLSAATIITTLRKHFEQADCGQKDTTEHAYVTCPEVQRIWNEAEGILISLIGAESVIEDED